MLGQCGSGISRRHDGETGSGAGAVGPSGEGVGEARVAAGIQQDLLKPSARRPLFSHQQGTIFEKLRIWTMPEFVRFIHDLKPVKENPDVVVTQLCFGTVPVRLYQPKAASSTPRRGVIFYHGGGGMFGSLSKSPSPRPRRAHGVIALEQAVWRGALVSSSWGQGTPGQLADPRSFQGQRSGMYRSLSGTKETQRGVYMYVYGA